MLFTPQDIMAVDRITVPNITTDGDQRSLSLKALLFFRAMNISEALIIPASVSKGKISPGSTDSTFPITRMNPPARMSIASLLRYSFLYLEPFPDTDFSTIAILIIISIRDNTAGNTIFQSA